MPKQLYDPGKGKMRVVGLVSGSGKGVIAIIDRQKEMRVASADNFEVVGIFTDNPEQSGFFDRERFRSAVAGERYPSVLPGAGATNK